MVTPSGDGGDSPFRDWYSNLLPNCYKNFWYLDAVAGRKVEEHLSHGEIAACCF